MINNLPSYARNFKFIVYRMVNGEKWFWGAYNDPVKAMHVAAQIGGTIA